MVIVEANKADIVCITESWLSEDVSDNKLNIAGFTCIVSTVIVMEEVS